MRIDKILEIGIECNCKLILTDQTLWTNISDELKQQIIEYQKATA